MEYETKVESGSTFRFVDDGQWVTVYVNGKKWGTPDGNRFIRALLNDIQKLKQPEMIDLWYIECRTGCSCCEYENFEQGFYRTGEEAKEQAAQWLAGNGNPLGSQYARNGHYYVRKGTGEILPDGRLIFEASIFGVSEWTKIGKLQR